MPGETILIIEDNPLNRELAADILHAAGYAILQAEDAEEGMALARAQRPSLILMDVSLPGIDGLRATGLLKQEAGTKEIPVLALTAHALKGDEERALAAGCDGYIPKPIDTRALPRAVASYLRPSSVVRIE